MASTPQPLTDQLELSWHCIQRFHQRFRPAIEPCAAYRELKRLIGHARIASEAPAWLARTARRDAAAYALIGDDMVLPLARTDRGWVAVTCLGRGGISDNARAGRNRRARARRARRAMRRRHD